MKLLTSRWRWFFATVAIGYLALMFSTGRLGSHGHFNQADTTGILREPPAAVTSLDLIRAARTVHLVKRAGIWQRDDGTEYHTHTLEHVASALGFMHTARPVRELEELDAKRTIEYGLEPPRLTVQLGNEVGVLLRFELGGVNPDGILRYLRVPGAGGVYLMSGFVGEAWEHLADDLFADEEEAL
ncbi:MAG: DUF4340 domain-containing protein [Gammaproteobacteria bacterium]|nr:DUF4340 domain-containing protein [Gammaproteobacteria bacterium]